MRGRELVAWNLRRIRVASGLSQAKLAAMVDMDQPYLGRIERQEVNPSVDLLEKIADGLKVGVSEFFEIPEEGDENPRPLPPGRRAV
jgi:transcriptional regulator with XRE-family HTH domain